MDSITQYLHLPISDSILVFTVVLGIILLAPIVFPKLRIPHLIGMIITGVLIGENGFNIIESNEGCELFSKIGIYYIMFLAGLEMDLAGLKHNRQKGLLFGFLTAVIPFAFGYFSGLWVLDYSQTASLLLACILASHTLVSYPIVGRYGLSKHKSVQISVVGTIVALMFALVVLATVAGTFTGDGGINFWLLFLLKFAIFLAVLFYVMPKVIRAFFKKVSDSVIQYIFVFTMMFVSAVTADICGLEGILGAFLAGLVFNRFIPHSSPLMIRVEFVGNAIFIPFFLLGVGMIVNVKPLFTSARALEVVGIMVIAGTLSKFLAAYFSRKMFKMSASGGLMMFGLSEAHAAGALAMVMVGRALKYPDGTPLMNNDVLDGVVVMILISCIISSISTDQACKKLKTEPEDSSDNEQKPWNDDEKIMVLINEPSDINGLVNTAIMTRNEALNRGLICLNVVSDAEDTKEWKQQSSDSLAKAEEICMSADVKVQCQSRLASNIVNGVIHAFRENDASEIILGLHRNKEDGRSLIGKFEIDLIDHLDRQIMLAHYSQQLNTMRRIVVAVPENAEYEGGFHRWVERVARLAYEIGCRVVFHATENACNQIMQYMQHYHRNVRAEYKLFAMHEGLGQLADSVNPDHILVVISARMSTVSYNGHINKQIRHIKKYFPENSIMIIYPDQSGQDSETTFFDPHGKERMEHSALTKWFSKWIAKMG